MEDGEREKESAGLSFHRDTIRRHRIMHRPGRYGRTPTNRMRLRRGARALEGGGRIERESMQRWVCVCVCMPRCGRARVHVLSERERRESERERERERERKREKERAIERKSER